MTISINFRDQQHLIESEGTLSKSLKKMGVSPQAVLAVRNGQLITEDEMLRDGDVLKLISVISGG